MSKITETRIGKVCAKHPELLGKRLASNGNCIQCARDAAAKQHAARTMTVGQEITMLRGQLYKLQMENDALKDGWQAECLKHGFDYVREPDDHYVLADPADMVNFLRHMLGVDVRQKEGDSYGESVSELNEEIEGLINTIHSIESFRKDAERYRWLRDPDHCEEDFLDGPADNIVVGSCGGEDIMWLDDMDRQIDEAMSKKAKP